MPETPLMTDRDIILEIRSDLKLLYERFDKMDREGSIGTKQELEDHERRLRALERFRYGWPAGIAAGAGAFIAVLTHYS